MLLKKELCRFSNLNHSSSGKQGGLSISDRIDLGVGRGVGLPAAIAAIWQMIRCYYRRED